MWGRETELTLVDRTVFVAVAVLLFLLAAVIAASALGWEGAGSAAAIARQLAERPVEAVIGALLILLAGVYVLLCGLRAEADEGIRQETEIGHVRISLRAIENLVYRTARGVRGIKDVAARVHRSPEGVAIAVSLVVHPDLPIPRLSDEVGHLVRSAVRETVGIEVGDVAIEIRNITEDARARVE